MLVADSAQPGVVMFAAFVVHDAGPGPVVERRAEPLVATVPHDDLRGLSTSARYWRGASVRSQCLIVAL